MVLYVKSKNGKGNNRHSLDIVRDILSVASARTRKTRIMYQANLSFVQVEKYLRTLLENDLMCHDGDACYLITKKGQDFLNLYGDYVRRCELINSQVEKSAQDRALLEQLCFNHELSGESKAKRTLSLP